MIAPAADPPPLQLSGGRATAVPMVQVALEEGFEGDAVEVRVGDEVVRREDVRTQRMIGLAELVDVSVPSGRGLIHVSLPARGLTVQLAVEVDEDVFVRVNVDGDQLTAVQTELLGYV